jgi:uncharacterized protein (TIGR02145 family)
LPGNGVVDNDGNTYQTIIINDSEWMTENLRSFRYSNGDSVLIISDQSIWQSMNTGACTIYNNDSLNLNNYGYLYNWYAVSDSRNICPSGWHVPSHDEWTSLTDYLGGSAIAGGKMKNIGAQFWTSPNIGATNESGFNAVPGGYRDNASFGMIGVQGYWWSSTEYDSGSATYRYLNNESTSIYGPINDKRDGFSIRCMKNLPVSGSSGYFWSPQITLIDSTGSLVLATPSETTLFTLTGYDSNGCTAVDTVIVNLVGNLVQLEQYSNSDGTACNGSAVILTGYSSDFSIQWSNGQNSSVVAVDTCFTLCPGPFSVLITDNTNLCSYSLSGIMQNTITGVDPLATYLNISNTSNNAPCNGSASIQAYGGTPPYQYQFVNSSGIESTSSADSLCSGIYTFKVFDNQMDSSIINFLICDSANIISNDNPIYQDSVIVDTLIVGLVENCDIDFATIDSVWIDSYSFIGTDSLIVYWNINDANGIHQVINRYNVTNCSGVFNLELSLFCSQKSTDNPYIKVYDQVYINTQEAGIVQLSRATMKVWPNPFNDELYVQWNAAVATDYFLLDAFGRVIQKGTLIPGEQNVDLKDVHKGLYLLKTNLKSSQAFRIVKI